jgi:hypothetical protein
MRQARPGRSSYEVTDWVEGLPPPNRLGPPRSWVQADAGLTVRNEVVGVVDRQEQAAIAVDGEAGGVGRDSADFESQDVPARRQRGVPVPGEVYEATATLGGGGFAAKPSATSSRWTAGGSVTAPTMRRGPPQRGQTRISIANTRRRSAGDATRPDARGPSGAQADGHTPRGACGSHPDCPGHHRPRPSHPTQRSRDGRVVTIGPPASHNFKGLWTEKGNMG